MEDSPLMFLDYDVVQMINIQVKKLIREKSKLFHINLYNDSYNFINLNNINKYELYEVFNMMTTKRERLTNVRYNFPFYSYNILKTLNVKHAIKVYENYLVEIEKEKDLGYELPCGIISYGGQCLCDICSNAY